MIEDKIIIALDTQDKNKLKCLLCELSQAKFFKVGLETFYAFGQDIIYHLKRKNKKVFLDLKLHDIPQTVYRSLKVLDRLGIEMINVHCLGGLTMLKKARQAVSKETKLIGVTNLTSLDQVDINTIYNHKLSLEELSLKMATMAQEANLDGVVTAASEVPIIKKTTHSKLLCITPGIRITSTINEDQKRIMSPSQALEIGSDYLVIGRSITQAPCPKKIYEQILKGDVC